MLEAKLGTLAPQGRVLTPLSFSSYFNSLTTKSTEGVPIIPISTSRGDLPSSTSQPAKAELPGARSFSPPKRTHSLVASSRSGSFDSVSSSILLPDSSSGNSFPANLTESLLLSTQNTELPTSVAAPIDRSGSMSSFETGSEGLEYIQAESADWAAVATAAHGSLRRRSKTPDNFASPIPAVATESTVATDDLLAKPFELPLFGQSERIALAKEVFSLVPKGFGFSSQGSFESLQSQRSQRALSSETISKGQSTDSLVLRGDEAAMMSTVLGIVTDGKPSLAPARRASQQELFSPAVVMQAELVEAEPVAEYYPGRDLTTVHEEEEADERHNSSKSEHQLQPHEPSIEQRLPAPAFSPDQSPYRGSQSLENLDQKDLSAPISSGMPRSISSPRLDQQSLTSGRSSPHLSGYAPSVASPLNNSSLPGSPKKRRKSYRGHKPGAYGTARHAMVNLTPENTDEMKRDAHAAIKDLLLRSIDEDEDREKRKRSPRMRSVTADYSSFSKPQFAGYLPDDTTSQISEPGDRASSFAPSIRTSQTVPDMAALAAPKPSFVRKESDFRASMAALDQIMQNEGAADGEVASFELPGAMSTSDFAADFSDYEESEEGYSDRASTLPGNDGLFDSDTLTLEGAEKALRYAKRTNDIDERVSSSRAGSFLLANVQTLMIAIPSYSTTSWTFSSIISLICRLPTTLEPDLQQTLLTMSSNFFVDSPTSITTHLLNTLWAISSSPGFPKTFEIAASSTKRTMLKRWNFGLWPQRGITPMQLTTLLYARKRDSGLDHRTAEPPSFTVKQPS